MFKGAAYLPGKVDLSRDQGEKLAWAEEVLMSKADLDERRQRITDLEAQACTEPYTPKTYMHEQFGGP